MTRNKKTLAFLPQMCRSSALFVIAGLAFCGCTKDITMDESGVRLRFINASPDAGGVQFALNDQNAHTPLLAYRDTTTYVAYPGGTYQLTIRNANTPIINTIVDLVPRASYSFFVVDSAGKMKVSIVKDELIPADLPLRARVRFFNLSPNAGVFSLRATTVSDTIIISNGRFFNDQDRSAIATRFAVLPSDIYNLHLYSGNNVVAVLPAQLLATGRTYTIYARGFAGGTAEKALSLGIIRHD